MHVQPGWAKNAPFAMWQPENNVRKLHADVRGLGSEEGPQR